MRDKKREAENEKKTLQKMPRVFRVCVCVRETEVKQQNIIKNWGAIYWKTT